MFEKLNYIMLSGVEYPIKCDMVVLERIQDDYGDFANFENRLDGFTPMKNKDGTYKKNEEGNMIGLRGEPYISDLKKALTWMVNEGVEIAKEEGREVPNTEGVNLMRKADMSPRELSEILRAEFARCFKRKNQETTQGEIPEMMKDPKK